MEIKEIRIYVECFEQGLDLQSYLLPDFIENKIKIVSLKKGEYKNYKDISIVSKFLSLKNFDAFITFISGEKEYPFLAIEYSTAVPTDDHIMQRFDGIYWASKLKIPFAKVSPTKINKVKSGGEKIKVDHEKILSFNMGGVYLHYDWKLIEETDFVEVNPSKVSCPKYTKELRKDIEIIKEIIEKEQTYEEIYSNIYNYYRYKDKELLDERIIGREKLLLNLEENNSSRLEFRDEKNLILKFNRFDHGMDPEKGMLYFFSTLGKKVSIRFDIHKMGEKQNIKKISMEDCINIFKQKTKSEILFKNSINNNIINISDRDLEEFLKGNYRQTVKSLFILGEKIILNGTDGGVLIYWNKEITNKYLEEIIKINKLKYEILPIESFQYKFLTEDLVTYSVQNFLRRKYNYEIIGVSYPGAQGDRVILKKSGKSSPREFIDIIAYKENQILLLESKESLRDSLDDIKKLNNLKNDKEKVLKLKTLINTLSLKKIVNDPIIKIGVCGKESKKISIKEKDMLLISFSPEIPNKKHINVKFKNKNNLILKNTNIQYNKIYFKLYYVI